MIKSTITHENTHVHQLIDCDGTIAVRAATVGVPAPALTISEHDAAALPGHPLPTGTRVGHPSVTILFSRIESVDTFINQLLQLRSHLATRQAIAESEQSFEEFRNEVRARMGKGPVPLNEIKQYICQDDPCGKKIPVSKPERPANLVCRCAAHESCPDCARAEAARLRDQEGSERK